MKVENYQFPKSSFLSIDKDFGIITNYILKNNRLKNMLYYTTPDCLSKPNLTEEQSISLFGRNIKISPKLTIDKDVLNYIFIFVDSFTPNATNPQFRDNLIYFDIICHYDQWNLTDFQMRPYKIAAELDTMFNNKHLSGIGQLQFFGANQIVLSDEFAGLCLIYQAIHGEDDKKHAPQPEVDKNLIDNFNEIFNNHEN